jgi:hypothetical protein
MKKNIAPCFITLAVAACSFPGPASSKILAQISTKDDPLVSKIRSSGQGQMCGISTDDGFVRLVSFGDRAVVDIGGNPTLLSYSPRSDGSGGHFGGQGIAIDMNFVADGLSEAGQVIGHKAGVQVNVGERLEHFYGLWDR